MKNHLGWVKDESGNEKKIGKGGFEDDDTFLGVCRHPEHNPPMHLHIPQGKKYRHICPGCGFEIVIHSSMILCKA